jgi:hypothetical protein
VIHVRTVKSSDAKPEDRRIGGQKNGAMIFLSVIFLPIWDGRTDRKTEDRKMKSPVRHSSVIHLPVAFLFPEAERSEAALGMTGAPIVGRVGGATSASPSRY